MQQPHSTHSGPAYPVGPDLQSVGFFRRLGAVFYDALVIFALSVFAHLPIQILFGTIAILPGDSWHPVYQAYLFGVSFLYFGWCWTHGGQTLGMRAWRIYLRDREGGPVPWWRALVRFLGAIISWLALGLGFVWALIDDKRMGWHDRLSGTLLIFVPTGGSKGRPDASAARTDNPSGFETMENFPAPEHNTLPKLLRMWADRAPDGIALREKDFGVWHELTWAEYRNRVAGLAVALNARGFGKGDVIGLMGSNEIWLTCAELATHAAGCMSLGIYRDTLEEEVGYLATYTDVSAVFAEDQEQVDKFLSLSGQLPNLRLIFYSEPRGLRHTGDERIVDVEALHEEGQAILAGAPGRFDELVDAVEGSDVAILCTTSGTTSNPKLAMLTGERFIDHVSRYLEVDPKTPGDEYVSVLPFPWIMEQVYTMGFNLISGMKVNFPESQDTAMNDLREIGPTFMLGAPRLWEQIAADMRSRIMDASKLNQWIFHTLIKRGMNAIDKGRKDTLADVVLFSVLRDRLGFSRVRSAATGGAALGPDTFKFFLAMGIPLRQLYGQTELIGAYTLQAPPGARMDCDSVGLPFRGSEVLIREPDQNGVGEIVTRHPNMFVGYHKNQAAFDADMRDGRMHTGDAGYFDDHGRLVIIDRMKDIAVKADGGKFSPQYIENKIKFSPFIGESVVLGAGREYLTAIICIRFSIMAKWAEKRRIPYTSYTNLSANPAVYDLIRDELEKVNETLVEGQQIRKFMLLFKELDADDGELTRTRKLRRALIHERYEQVIKALYSDAPVAHINTQVTYEDGRKGRIHADMEIRVISDS